MQMEDGGVTKTTNKLNLLVHEVTLRIDLLTMDKLQFFEKEVKHKINLLEQQTSNLSQIVRDQQIIINMQVEQIT